MGLVCKDCGAVSEPKRVTKGSMGIEIILWCCFLIPGLIYSVWRLGSRYDACRICKSSALLPLSSPIGKKIAAENGYVEPPPYRGSPAAEQFGRRLGRLFANKKK